MHLAGKAFDSMRKNTIEFFKNFDATDEDRKTIRMAALLHDVGHAPFSHSLEYLLDNKHEKYSQALVDYYFVDKIEEAGIKPKNVKDLIDGTYSVRPYLGKIVSGQLDVDRLDYLLRDSHYAGVTYGIYDLGRIIEQLCVVDGKFVVLEGGYEAVEQLFFARYQMYQQVYFQKTKMVFELMLRKCGQILKDRGLLDIPTLDDLKTKEGQEKFLSFDDRWFLNRIYRDDNPQEVKDIANMIKNREHYLEVYSPRTDRKPPTEPTHGPENTVKSLKPIQDAILHNRAKLGIDEHEFLIDEAGRSPYNLESTHNEGGNDSIRIYYKNNKYSEPIEKRSHVVYALATNKPSMMRGFVTPSKYEQIRKYLNNELNYKIPDRKK